MTIVWFTGLPCSGKTTVADAVAERLRERGVRVERLDGDIIRTHLSKDLGFSREDRDENLKRVGFVSNLLSRNGVIVLASFVSPYRDVRDKIRSDAGDRFLEVFVDCPVSECMNRDVKGMYKKALNGYIKGFTGVDDPYEAPLNPELVLNTNIESLDESVNKVVSKLEERGVV